MGAITDAETSGVDIAPVRVRERRLGAAGLRISEIGFGCGPTARLMVSGSEREQVATVASALERGVTYFDTAARYGDGASERNLGRALGMLSASPAIATKVTVEEADLADIAGAVVRSVEGSLARLRRDSVAVVHLHNRIGRDRAPRPDVGSGMLLSIADVLGPNGVAEGFERLRRRGLVERVGGCAFGGEMPALAEVLDAGMFQSLLVNYSMLNPTAFEPVGAPVQPDYQGIAARAAAAGVGIVALRVLEGGILAGHHAPPAAAELDFLLEDCATLAEAAIRHALSNAAVSTVLVGISDLDQLAAAADAAARGPLPEHLFARLRGVKPIAAA